MRFEDIEYLGIKHGYQERNQPGEKIVDEDIQRDLSAPFGMPRQVVKSAEPNPEVRNTLRRSHHQEGLLVKAVLGLGQDANQQYREPDVENNADEFRRRQPECLDRETGWFRRWRYRSRGSVTLCAHLCLNSEADLRAMIGMEEAGNQLPGMTTRSRCERLFVQPGIRGLERRSVIHTAQRQARPLPRTKSDKKSWIAADSRCIVHIAIRPPECAPDTQR